MTVKVILLFGVVWILSLTFCFLFLSFFSALIVIQLKLPCTFNVTGYFNAFIYSLRVAVLGYLCFSLWSFVVFQLVNHSVIGVLMAVKRLFGEDDLGSDVPSRESKRFASVVTDVMKGISVQEFATRMEPFFRSLVREEAERAILRFHHSSSRPSLNQIESSGTSAWQLHFVTKLPSTLFTGSRIESEDNKQVKIVIIDALSKKIITSGSLSSIKIEIVVLDGDFVVDDQEDWSEKEFNAKVIREREGKRPLVTGDRVITMENGVGYIGDISFTDNSSWIRGRKFRLGARTVQSISTEARIREARSEAFIVKDHRGESYKKHHPPSLGDEVWRLEKIAKDGAFHTRLADKGIRTVKDFLRFRAIDESSLRKTLGGGISNKSWQAIIDHATACVLDDKMYLYYMEAERVGLLFNSIYHVIGANFDGQNYQSLHTLNSYQMRQVQDLKQHAYKNLNNLVEINEPSLVGPSLPLSSLQDQFGSPNLVQDVNFPVSQQDQLEMQLGFNHTTSTGYGFEVEDGSQLEVSMGLNCHPVQAFLPMLSNNLVVTDSCPGPYSEANNWAPGGSLGQVVQIGHPIPEYNAHLETSTWKGNGFFFPPSNGRVGIRSSNFGIQISRNGKPKVRWFKVRAALKWGISVRRDVAAKRMAGLLLPKCLTYSF
ncbi:calmodulin-binding protein 60 B-like isoform X2 [Cornus florida]|uniref:calmodulin-binding protein 60 B-like isoform X2 n=1 Tax=Cornus florida TaxID=4283 RepID=UPI0028A0B950|nr:calmodulin-binding protein 60 B-like isoform X2 [Cornus florida]